ncbi:MAG: hypothetical protein IT184_01560 [Acidobacteria bacterium]|nr:hypothetical protein [Acidobacteriota bacterium]
MPSIRYARDKRGYETTCVVHQYRGSGGPGPTRVLYLFRTPAHVTVGRRPLDDESRVALEHTHPDISFDWQGLSRDVASSREPAPRVWRERGPRAARAEPPRPRPSDDTSTLGRALGAERAARLRGRYAELRDRVERRARTPEERQELIARLARLNPDDWPDERAAAAAAATIDADWDAILAALPQRRRGRRGGRRREETPGQAQGTSAIISGEGDVNEVSDDGQGDRPVRDAGAAGDGHPVGPAGGDGLQGDH